MRIRKKVLIVDDDKSRLHNTLDLLESDEIEVVTHTSVFGVTSLVKSMQPYLVLFDINMTLPGDKLASLIHDYCDASDIPVFFCSFNDESSMVESLTGTGSPGYAWKGDPSDIWIKIKRDISQQAKNS